MVGALKTVTLGCKVNQYETQYVREALLKAGYTFAQPGEAAELCLVNSCTVTAESDAKSRQAIRRLIRENPEARVVVMGCYATRAPEEIVALGEGVEVLPDKRDLPTLLSSLGVVEPPVGISRFGDRSRAYVKVQDGCRLRCTYCIIPQVRPHLSSRPVVEVLNEVRRLVDNGYGEIVLTGVHLGHYGRETAGGGRAADTPSLATLVRQIAAVAGEFRVRLSSIEATEVTPELLETMRDSPDKVCPHLHICLQSGSDRVLHRMRRRWSRRSFLQRCQLVRERLDQPALTTDVLVGFPGETDADFEDTCRVLQEVGFSKIHAFPFSPRAGTPAAVMPDPVPRAIRTARVRQVAEIERDLRQRYFSSLIGRRLRVLVEAGGGRYGDGRVGTACRYAPVELPAGGYRLGQLVDVKADEVLAGARIRAV